jgi:hypothetical protein
MPCIVCPFTDGTVARDDLADWAFVSVFRDTGSTLGARAILEDRISGDASGGTAETAGFAEMEVSFLGSLD